MRKFSPMDRRLGARVAPILALLVAIPIGAAGFLTSGAGAAGPTTAPDLVASIPRKPSRVVLKWTFETDSKQRERTLEIQRSIAGGAWQTVITRHGPNRRGTISDNTPPTARTSYRARVLIEPFGETTRVAQLVTAWGAVATVDPADVPTTTTTAKPTTTTVKPTTTTTVAPPPPAGISPCPETWDTTVIADVNRERTRAGKPALDKNTKLGNAANKRGIYLAELGRLDDHATYVQEINAAGYYWSWVGENIHAYVGVDSVVAGWMASAPHKANILSSNFDDVGVGCGLDRRGVPFWSLIFGRGN
jgi:uncharacterized protein YkwD